MFECRAKPLARKKEIARRQEIVQTTLKYLLKFYDCLLFSRIFISYLLAGGFEFLMGRKVSQSAMFSVRFSQLHNSPVYLLFFYA